MRLAPDLSSYGSSLPELEELLPEEIAYLCDVCAWLGELGVCQRGLKRGSSLEAHFDADELGLDPEDD